jgi:lysophospholipase L1-like esterase
MIQMKYFTVIFMFLTGIFHIAGAKEIKVALACSSACESYRQNNPDEDCDPRRVWGWGEVLGGYFNNNVKILNFAKSGRCTVTFREQGWWDKLLASKPDYVIMALGANDANKEPQTADSILQFKENLRRFYREAEAINAKTIFVTLNQSMYRGDDDTPVFRDGKAIRADRIPYSQAIREIAAEFKVPCLDLFTEQAKAMEQIGEKECATYYCIQRLSDRHDPSHTNIMGAHFLANIIATELSKANTPLAKEINKKRLWQYKLTPKKVIKK